MTYLMGQQDCVVASRQSLESWISRHIAKPKTPKTTPTPAPADKTPKKEDAAVLPAESPSEVSISTSDVVCSHGKLDPDKAGDMKVIRAVSNLPIRW